MNVCYFPFSFSFLVQASERLLETHGIQKTDALFLSNAPAGIVKIRFKEDEERGQTYQGAKVDICFIHIILFLLSMSNIHFFKKRLQKLFLKFSSNLYRRSFS